LEGKLHKTASGFYSYDIVEADNDFIYKLANVLTKQFGFDMVNTPMTGLDGVYWDAIKKNVKLTVGWDNWSGAFVMAHCSEGDEYVAKISEIMRE
jgi:hypothetical protein